MERALDIQGVTKRFGAVVACDNVSMSVEPGEVRGLLGQNGAGKSTLMKIVAGIERADAGSVRVSGSELRLADPHASSAAGIGMVHQHFSLVERFKVWENLTLGEAGRLDGRASARRVAALGERYGLEVDPHAYVADLAPGERQRVEILKCLRSDPHLIILDEPTSVLTRAEANHLFSVLSMLVHDEARAIILISHRLEEVLEVTDRITVLRDGAIVSTFATADADVNILATEMLGRAVTLRREGAALGLASADTVFAEPESSRIPKVSTNEGYALEIDRAVAVAPDGHRMLDGLSLGLRRGEILGIAGVEGNGQAALVDVLSGVLRLNEGTVSIDGLLMQQGRPADFGDIGIVPPDGPASGCVLQLSIAENLVLDRPGEVLRHRVISKRLLRERAQRLVADYGIATPSVDIAVGALSGGNRQRVILARELSRTPKVLVASQPTQGLDVGAMEDIWTRLRAAAAAAGTAILLISPDLDEIVAISDRVAVIYRGRLVGEMNRSEFDQDRLGLLMGGAKA